eukprot:15159826-Heterocapsa_arctica.AAC.1
MYSRLSEVLALKGKDICVAQARPQLIAVRIRPKDDEAEGTVRDLAHAADQRAAPAKSGQYDGTVLLGEKESYVADRGFVADIVVAMKKLTRDNQFVFPISLAQFERAVERSCERLGLKRLKLTPHIA